MRSFIGGIVSWLWFCDVALLCLDIFLELSFVIERLALLFSCCSMGFSFPGSWRFQRPSDGLRHGWCPFQTGSWCDGWFFWPNVMSLPLPTRNARKDSMRRIDYGLCSGNFCPQRLMRYAGVADQQVWQFGYHMPAPAQADASGSHKECWWCCNPLFCRFGMSLLFLLCWEGLRQMLRCRLCLHRLNLLYNQMTTSHVITLQGQSLAPVKFRGVAKSAQQSGTILLSRVRRLHRLCLQLQRELDHVALRRICLRGLVALAGRIPEVHDWHACARLEAEHKCSRFRTWRENNHGNLAEQITWIKRRVKLLAEVSLRAWMFQWLLSTLELL